MLMLVLLGCFISVPPVDRALHGTLAGSPLAFTVAGLLSISAGLIALSIWGAALWYASVSPDVIVPRPWVITGLVLTSFVGAFAYYWLAVHWRPTTRKLRRVHRHSDGAAA